MLYFCIRPLKSAANLYLGILLITQKRDYIKKTGPEVFQKSKVVEMLNPCPSFISKY